jgi:hypothetical protein
MQDKARRDGLHARGFHHERGGIHEKMLQRFAASPPDYIQGNNLPHPSNSVATGHGSTGIPRHSVSTASTRPTTTTTNATTTNATSTPTMMTLNEFLNNDQHQQKNGEEGTWARHKI